MIITLGETNNLLESLVSRERNSENFRSEIEILRKLAKDVRLVVYMKASTDFYLRKGRIGMVT